MNLVSVQTPAKVNLFLDIVGVDDKGYHLLNTLMHSVSLYDEIVIRQNDSHQIMVLCDTIAPSGEDNIVYGAAKLFFDAFPHLFSGIEITIHKKIPTQAGLGGGSSNAAGVILGLNHMYDCQMDEEQLQTMGLFVGADVPFCIQGGCCLAQGIGEKLTPMRTLPKDWWVVLVKPKEGISTKIAFAEYDKNPAKYPIQSDSLFFQGMHQQDIDLLGAQMYNLFEVISPNKTTQQIRTALLQHGAKGAVLSGSGSTVVGLFESEIGAKQGQNALRDFHQTYLAQFSSQGCIIKSL